MTLKTVREQILPAIPSKEEKDSFERTTRFRKGELTIFKELQKTVYADLVMLEGLIVSFDNIICNDDEVVCNNNNVIYL